MPHCDNKFTPGLQLRNNFPHPMLSTSMLVSSDIVERPEAKGNLIPVVLGLTNLAAEAHCGRGMLTT